MEGRDQGRGAQGCSSPQCLHKPGRFGTTRSTPVHSRRVANLLLLKGLVPEPQCHQSVARSGRIRFDSFPAHHPHVVRVISPESSATRLRSSPRLVVDSFPAHFFYVRRVGPLLSFPALPRSPSAISLRCGHAAAGTLQRRSRGAPCSSRRPSRVTARAAESVTHTYAIAIAWSTAVSRGAAGLTVKAAPTIRTSALTDTKTSIDILLHTACMPCADLRQGRRRSNQDAVARPRPHSAMESRQVRSTSARRPWCQAMRLSLPQETFAAAERRRPAQHRR